MHADAPGGRRNSGGIAYGDGEQPLQRRANSTRSSFGSGSNVSAVHRTSAPTGGQARVPPLRAQGSGSHPVHHNAADAAAFAAHGRQRQSWLPEPTLSPLGHLPPRPSGSLSAREHPAAERRGFEGTDFKLQSTPRSLSALGSEPGQRLGLFVRSHARMRPGDAVDCA